MVPQFHYLTSKMGASCYEIRKMAMIVEKIHNF